MSSAPSADSSRVAVVTGAAGGIGLAVSRRLAAEGLAVVLADLDGPGVASVAGKEGNANMAAYSTAKAAVIGFTKAVAREVAETGVLVNCVTPAVIQTGILEQVGRETLAGLVAKIPMGRTGRPEEVAELIAWLASPRCSFSTGAAVDISGGR